MIGVGVILWTQLTLLIFRPSTSITFTINIEYFWQTDRYINHQSSDALLLCIIFGNIIVVAIYHQSAWCFFSSLITLSSSITLPCHWGDGKKWRQDGGAGIDDWSYNRHMGWLQPQKLMMDQCCQLQKTADSRRKYNLKFMKGKRVWFLGWKYRHPG